MRHGARCHRARSDPAGRDRCVLVGGGRRTRVAATAAVAASGLAAAGLEARVFVGDEPSDPAFIQWVAAVPLFAFVVAMVLIGCAAWGLLEPLPQLSRLVLIAAAAVVSPSMLAVVLLTGMPFVMLVAIASPLALVTVVVARRQRRQAPI